MKHKRGTRRRCNTFVSVEPLNALLRIVPASQSPSTFLADTTLPDVAGMSKTSPRRVGYVRKPALRFGHSVMPPNRRAVPEQPLTALPEARTAISRLRRRLRPFGLDQIHANHVSQGELHVLAVPEVVCGAR